MGNCSWVITACGFIGMRKNWKAKVQSLKYSYNHNTIFVLFLKFNNTFIAHVFRDGQSGKLTVDDYGAKTGRSPGKMRQLNINGPLYVGKWNSQLITP